MKKLKDVLSEEEVMKLYNSQKKLMHKVANGVIEYSRDKSIDYEDIISVLTLTFVRYLYKYEVGSKAKFTTYIYPAYKTAAYREVNKNTDGISYSSGVSEEISKFSKLYDDLPLNEFLEKAEEKVLNGEMTRGMKEACMQKMFSRGISLDKDVTKDGVRVGSFSNTVSYESTIRRGGNRLKYFREPRDISNIELNKLPTFHKFWIIYHLEGFTQREISEVLGMSNYYYLRKRLIPQLRSIIERYEDGLRINYKEEERISNKRFMKLTTLNAEEVANIKTFVEDNFEEYVEEMLL